MNKVYSIDVGEIVLEDKDFNGVIDSNKIASLSLDYEILLIGPYVFPIHCSSFGIK